MKKIKNEKLAEFDSSLELYVYDHPFKHIVFTSDTLKELCTRTFNIGMKSQPFSNVINGSAQANVGFPRGTFDDIPDELMYDYPTDLLNLISQEYFSKQYNSAAEAKWNCTPNESTVVNQTSIELESAVLYPHTDDPVELIRENTINRLSTEVGIIKLVMYTGDDSRDYAEYGTKLYTKKEAGYNDDGGYSGFNLIKEIEYVNGYAMMWAPGADTWHGTDFCSNNVHRRIFFTGEFY